MSRADWYDDQDAWAVRVRDLEQELEIARHRTQELSRDLAAAQVRIQGLEQVLDAREAECATMTTDRDWWRDRRQP
jgi:predicted  nucleic acid-binding Zn-ribbon protein